jgi:hypothetical protein
MTLLRFFRPVFIDRSLCGFSGEEKIVVVDTASSCHLFVLVSDTNEDIIMLAHAIHRYTTIGIAKSAGVKYTPK